MLTKQSSISKLFFLFAFSLLFISFRLISQERFSSESMLMTSPKTSNVSSPVCSSSSGAYQNKYSQQSFYIPKKNQKVITLKITVHVFKPIEDNGNWQMNDNPENGLPALKFLLDSITNGNQERFSVKRKASYTVENFSSPYIHDSKIQFEVTNIYFYSNPDLYRSMNDYALFEYIEKTDPSRIEEGMPLVINANPGPGHLSSYKGCAAVVTSMTGDPIFCRSHLLHEIGHAFGLGHTYMNGGGAGSDWQNFNGYCGAQDYLSDVFPNNNPACQHEKQATTKPDNSPCFSCYESTPDTSNNLMGGQRYNLWMSPLQMGRRIRSMHFNFNSGRNLRMFAKDMESDHKNAWVISENETWDFDIQMYNDILVKTGVTLTIKCKIAMAINGKIKLEKGAKLIVDSGEITGWCKTGKWLGIELPSTKKEKGNTNLPSLVSQINGGQINKFKKAFK